MLDIGTRARRARYAAAVGWKALEPRLRHEEVHPLLAGRRAAWSAWGVRNGQPTHELPPRQRMTPINAIPGAMAESGAWRPPGRGTRGG